MSAPIQIKGDWCDVSEAVEFISKSAPSFVFINSNGCFIGKRPINEIDQLIGVLSKYKLDPTRAPYISTNPCRAKDNPEWCYGSKLPRWIDGDRLFPVDGVTYFHGNFEAYSHAFSIYTNDKATIDKLSKAINNNLQKWGNI